MPCGLILAVTLSAAGYGLPLEGALAEEFLRSAKTVEVEPIGVGITNPMKVTLTDGKQTHYAVWKTIDEYRHGLYKGRSGGYQQSFRDSYKFEIAAYELDKLLGLGLVPPTVEREIGGRTGSLQMWVDGAFTELDRRERGLRASDARSWSDQLYKLRTLQQLIYNDDAQNIRNVVYDPSFRVYAIDNSRSFRRFPFLADESGLRRFSRSLMEQLSALNAPMLEERLGRLLTGAQIDAILARRDLLLAKAVSLAEDLGEDMVFYP